MTLNVFLDANVLVPIAMTDVLMRLGAAGLKDLPVMALAKHGIQAKTPDRLLRDLLEAGPERTIQVIRDAAAATRNPPLGVDRILESLARSQGAGFAAAATAWLKAHAVAT
ncbi:MAG: hypothetical protein LBK95_02800 [Bifidobacteriaceae bacterium]|jgi:hypothetical protein|nr:hypothetical protein [Bifidobacteriaceae bacterium]